MGVPTKGGYVIKNNNDFVLENKESKKDDKNPIIANKGKKGPNQIWVIELTKANKFIIRNPESNKCFTAEGRLFYILTCDKSSKKQNFELGTSEKNTPANETVKPAVTPVPQTVKPAVTPVPQTVKPAVPPAPQRKKPSVTPQPQTLRPADILNYDYEIPYFTATNGNTENEHLRN